MRVSLIFFVFSSFYSSVQAQPELRWSVSSKETQESEKENNIYFDGKGNNYRFFKKYDVDTSFYVDKLDENGNLKLNKKISGLGYESTLIDVVFDDDGSLYILSYNRHHVEKKHYTAKLTKLNILSESVTYSFIIDSIKSYPLINFFNGELYIIGIDKAQILYKFTLDGILVQRIEIDFEGIICDIKLTKDRIYGYVYNHYLNNTGISKIVCFKFNGEKIWETKIADQSNFYVKSSIDSKGGIVYCYSLFYLKTFVLRIDSNGIIHQHIEFNNSYNHHSCIDKNDNVYLAFYDYDNLFRSIKLFKINKEGYQLITKLDSVSFISSHLSINVSARPDGSIIIVYNKNSLDSLNITEIISIDSSGLIKWKNSFNLENNFTEIASKININESKLFLSSQFSYSGNPVDFSIISSFEIPLIENNIDKPIDNFSFVIYPNPNSIKTIFFKPELTKADVFIYDNLGKLILSNLSFNGNSLELPINISVGLYSIIVRKDGKNYYKKLVIQ